MNAKVEFQQKFVDFLDNNWSCPMTKLAGSVANNSIDFDPHDIQLMVGYHAVNMGSIRILALRRCTSLVDHVGLDFGNHIYEWKEILKSKTKS